MKVHKYHFEITQTQIIFFFFFFFRKSETQNTFNFYSANKSPITQVAPPSDKWSWSQTERTDTDKALHIYRNHSTKLATHNKTKVLMPLLAVFCMYTTENDPQW